MNNLELYATEGELKARTNRQFLERLHFRRSHGQERAGYYTGVIALLDRIHCFVDNEVVLFTGELISHEGRDLDVRIINMHNKLLGELLDDLVNLHIDEPDGSFEVGLSKLTAEFEQLIGAMRDSLAALDKQKSGGLDFSSLQVLTQQAA